METLMRKLWIATGIAVVLWTGLAAQGATEFLDKSACKKAQRIWNDARKPAADLYFRRSFVVGKNARELRLVSSCDDICTVYLDGVRISHCGAWEELRVSDIEALAAGKHVIAVKAHNRLGPAALAVWLTWTDARGKQQLTTDKSWRFALEAGEAWTKPGFDDRRWQAAQECSASSYGQTVYDTNPKRVVFTTGFRAKTDALASALARLRAAKTNEERLGALADMQKHVLGARRIVRRLQAKTKRR